MGLGRDVSVPRLQIRPASVDDAVRVQELRKNAWRKRYVHPETGVTAELLETELAPLPPTEEDLATYQRMLAKAENRKRNLVAVGADEIVGALTYDTLADGTGDIGVFVADEWNDRGIGDQLLATLIAETANPLQVEIFARNPSREFYKRRGFHEAGAEGRADFTDEAYLPTQVLRLDR
jgi:GNAT superfamily N-acetyltransferase